MNTRVHYLDNLRSAALLLGLVFHALIVYSTGIGYTVKSQETSEVYTWFVLFVHTFRMPLFFLLSGYFSELLFSKKGDGYFYQSRIYRVGVPIFVGLLFFSPIDGYFREIQKHGLINYFTYLSIFFQSDSFTLSHVWFVYYLMIFSALYVVVRRYLLLIPRMSLYFFYPIFLILGFASIFLPNLFYTKEEIFLQIRPMFFFYYFFFFLSGVYIFKHNLLDKIIPTPRQALFLGFILSVGFGGYMLLEELDQYWMYFLFDPKRITWRVIHLSLEIGLAFGWILIFLAFTKRILNFENLATRELANSLLPVYLVHHPVSIALGYVLGNGMLPRELAVLIHILLVFSLSFGFYVVVKYFRATAFLFGLKPQNSGLSSPRYELTNRTENPKLSV